MLNVMRQNLQDPRKIHILFLLSLLLCLNFQKKSHERGRVVMMLFWSNWFPRKSRYRVRSFVSLSKYASNGAAFRNHLKPIWFIRESWQERFIALFTRGWLMIPQGKVFLLSVYVSRKKTIFSDSSPTTSWKRKAVKALRIMDTTGKGCNWLNFSPESRVLN